MRQYWRLFRRPPAHRRRAAVRLAGRALRDDRGGEVLEYALVASLIVMAAVSTIGCVGTKLLARWNSINSRL